MKSESINQLMLRKNSVRNNLVFKFWPFFSSSSVWPRRLFPFQQRNYNPHRTAKTSICRIIRDLPQSDWKNSPSYPPKIINHKRIFALSLCQWQQLQVCEVHYFLSITKFRKQRRGGNQSPGVYNGRRMTYAELIVEAIKSSKDSRMTLRQIYHWMSR